MLPLIKGLVSLQPTCELHSSSLRTAIFQLLLENPRVNQTKINGTAFINLRIERVTALLYHFRRLKSAEDLRRCASHLTSPELLELQEVLDMVDKKEAPQPCFGSLFHLTKVKTSSRRRQSAVAESSKRI